MIAYTANGIDLLFVLAGFLLLLVVEHVWSKR